MRSYGKMIQKTEEKYKKLQRNVLEEAAPDQLNGIKDVPI